MQSQSTQTPPWSPRHQTKTNTHIRSESAKMRLILNVRLSRTRPTVHPGAPPRVGESVHVIHHQWDTHELRHFPMQVDAIHFLRPVPPIFVPRASEPGEVVESKHKGVRAIGAWDLRNSIEEFGGVGSDEVMPTKKEDGGFLQQSTPG